MECSIGTRLEQHDRTIGECRFNKKENERNEIEVLYKHFIWFEICL